MLKVLYLILISLFIDNSFAITSDQNQTEKNAEKNIDTLDPLYFATYDKYFQQMSIFFKYDGAKHESFRNEGSYNNKDNFLFSYAVTTGLPNLDLMFDRFWASNYNKFRAKWISFTLHRDIGVEEDDLKLVQDSNVFYSSNESLYIAVFALLGSLFFIKKRKKLRRKSYK